MSPDPGDDGGMFWGIVAAVAAVWTALALLLCIVIGRAVRMADREESVTDLAPPVEEPARAGASDRLRLVASH